MKRTIHFVYTVPRSSNIIRRVIDKIIAKIRIMPPLHRSGKDFLIPWRKPVRAPHSISHHLLNALKKHGKVKFYSLYENTVCKMRKDDILIGSPIQDYSKLPLEKPDYNTVLIRTLERYPDHKNTFIIMPYSNHSRYVGWAKTIIEKFGKNIILIAGKIWLENPNKSSWESYDNLRKMRVDMGIDTVDYPVVKKTFNKKGNRGFLYVGHTSWYKNTDQLEKIARSMPNFKFGHIGGGHIEGWKKIAEFTDLTPVFMSKIAEEYDFFINCSSADPQATTILEHMCFGFVVACTPESGYDYDSIIPLKVNDVGFNCSQLNNMQLIEENELLAHARKNLDYVLKFHSWDLFCNKVINFVFNP